MVLAISYALCIWDFGMLILGFRGFLKICKYIYIVWSFGEIIIPSSHNIVGIWEIYFGRMRFSENMVIYIYSLEVWVNYRRQHNNNK
jgi:hypothetical protein